MRKTDFRRILFFAGMFVSLCANLFAQQYPVQIQVAVLPPYSPRMSDYFTYEHQCVVTVTAAPTLPPNTPVKFLGALDGDNGIHIATKPGYQPPNPLVLNPGETRFLTGTELQPYFDVNQVDFSGITRREIEQNSALPEGYYTICFAAYHFQNGQQLSEPEPAGCSGGFFIQHVEPPQWLTPECAAPLTPGQPQNVVFSWSYPIGVTAPVQYLLKIVEVIPPDRDPNEAMNVPTTPPFFEQVVDGQNYVYGPADPPLEPGKAYAAQVIAYDPANLLVFNNQGRSEVCGFDISNPEEPGGGSTVTSGSTTTGGCLCTIDHTPFGGPAIKVKAPLEAHRFPELKHGQAIGLSALAEDFDIIVQKCMLNGVWEKLIEKVGDPVSYAWALEAAPAAWKLLDAEASSTMLLLPHYIKKGATETGTVKLKITSALDEEIEGSLRISVIGRDTCETDSIAVEITPLAPKADKIPGLTTTGQCKPKEEKWERNGKISAFTVETSGKYVQAGQVMFLKAKGDDTDDLTLFCQSDGCGNPEKKVTVKEALVFEWSDGGAKGKFIPGATGSGVLYIAPDKAGKVKITCKAKDAGNHRAASGETEEKTVEIEVVDALTELNMIHSTADFAKYLTVGTDPVLKQTWSTTPAIEVLKSQWCLELGGPSGKVEALLEKAGGLTLSEASLVFSPGETKDVGRKISWQQHHHIHGKHRLMHRITFRFKGEKILYTDEKWTKSNFLEGGALDEYKLFFNKKNTLAERRDDGKWRDDKTQDDDLFGKTITLNETKPPDWLTHWADNTYKPCALPADFKIDLTRKDIKFVYGDPAGDAFAEYQWLGGENQVVIGKKSAETAKISGLDKEFSYVSSDCKKVLKKKVKLNGFELEGLECFAKVISHELAHWQGITKNWGAKGEWKEAYGDHTTFRPWADVAKTGEVDLKDVTCAKTLFTATYGNSKEVTLVTADVTDKKGEDAETKYSLHLTLKIPIGKTKEFTVYELNIKRGWFVEGGLEGGGKDLKGGTIFYSEHDAVTTCRKDGTKFTPPNGIVLTKDGKTFTVCERHNDLDGDFVPNLVEDEIGLDWRRSVTHGEATYHGKPNDQEFWAEWSTTGLIDPATKRLKKGTCDPEKDWANPGLQTKK